MPNSNEQPSSSDDLIAELARLMAEEAQSDRPAAQKPAPIPATPPASEPEKPQKLPTGGTVVRVPGARPAAGSGAPTGSVWGRGSASSALPGGDWISEPVVEAPSISPSRPTQTSAPVPPVIGAAGTPRSETDDDDFLSALKWKPAGSGAEQEGGGDAPDEDAPDKAISSSDEDLIAALIAEQEREETVQKITQFKPVEKVREPKPTTIRTPIAPSGPVVPSPMAPRHAPKQPSAPETAQGNGPVANEDVLSLLRAMNASEAKVPVEPDDGSEDRFFAAPIFGLSEDGSPAGEGSTDPLDDIENLIGDAVKLSHGDRRSASAAAEKEPNLNDAAYAAEAAIAAAAAETGRPERLKSRPAMADPMFGSLDDAVATTRRGGPGETEKPRTNGEIPAGKPGSNRLIVGAAAAVTVLVALGLGLFWMFGGTPEPDGTVPVLASNTVDAKSTPESTTPDTTQPVIFNELDGTNTETPTDEQIVSRDQSGNVATDIRQVATPETADESLANRKVRTVTVRPDGTIVSNDDTVAATEVLPVDRPNVPALSTDSGETTDFAVTSTPPAATTDVASAGADNTGTPAADPIAAIVDSATAEAQASTGELVANAPYPAVRPSAFQRAAAPTRVVTTAPAQSAADTNTIDLIAGRANEVATQTPAPNVTPPVAAAPVTTTTATPATASNDVAAAAYVQLSSQRNLDAANTTMASMRQRYQGLFNGADAFIRRVDLGTELGIYYRVLVPANSLADANGICASVKAAGGDCFVRSN